MVDTDCRFDERGYLIPCKGMNGMLESRSVCGVGVAIAHIIHFKTMKERDIGVYFKFTKKVSAEIGGTKKLMFNVCPFCRKEILKLDKSEEKTT